MRIQLRVCCTAGSSRRAISSHTSPSCAQARVRCHVSCASRQRCSPARHGHWQTLCLRLEDRMRLLRRWWRCGNKQVRVYACMCALCVAVGLCAVSTAGSIALEVLNCVCGYCTPQCTMYTFARALYVGHPFYARDVLSPFFPFSNHAAQCCMHVRGRGNGPACWRNIAYIGVPG